MCCGSKQTVYCVTCNLEINTFSLNDYKTGQSFYHRSRYQVHPQCKCVNMEVRSKEGLRKNDITFEDLWIINPRFVGKKVHDFGVKNAVFLVKNAILPKNVASFIQKFCIYSKIQTAV